MIKKKFKKLVIYFSLLMLFHSQLFGSSEVQKILNRIPENDREILKALFYDLFNQDNFSYTLFGDKPISLADYSTTLFDDEGMPVNKDVKFWNKWAVWKKYANAFPMAHYLLLEVPERGSRSKEIYFINKKCFIEKVNQHSSLFKKLLGDNVTGAILLEKIEKNPKFLSLLNNHQILIGILLGYGEHNAKLFNERHRLSPFIYKKDLPKLPLKILTPSKGYSSLEEEFNSYFSVLTLFGDSKYSPLIIFPVHFVADHQNPETIALQEKYKKMRGKICSIYAQGDFLEITLSELIKSD